VVSRRTLNQLGEALGIHGHLEARIGNQPIQQTLVGNALEALFGALYLDFGYRRTEKILMRLLQKHGIYDRMYEVTDFKSKLHEYCQKKKLVLQFSVDKEKQHADDYYETSVFVGDRRSGVGRGRSKKSAEQAAAREACLRIFGGA
jgi:ribonuclease-3